MEELKELEQAIAETEQRAVQVKAARFEPIKQALLDVDTQLAEVDAANAKLKAAREDLPTSPRSPWLWWTLPAAAVVAAHGRGEPLWLGVVLGSWLVAFGVGRWFAGRAP